jgi:hypothetical protein
MPFVYGNAIFYYVVMAVLRRSGACMIWENFYGFGCWEVSENTVSAF